MQRLTRKTFASLWQEELVSINLVRHLFWRVLTSRRKTVWISQRNFLLCNVSFRSSHRSLATPLTPIPSQYFELRLDRAVISRATILALTILIVTARARQTQSPKTFSLQGDISPIHDPTMIRQGGTYYVFATNRFNGKLLPIFCSQDLEQWKFCGNVFDAVPDWALKQIPGQEESGPRHLLCAR
jgi:Beta-xylosidase